MQVTPSASNLNPELQEQIALIPSLLHTCEQPPFRPLSHK